MSNRIITAIDIGSTKIATVIASLSDDKTPSVIGVSSYPSRGIKKGVVVNIEDAMSAIIDSLEAAERMAGITSKFVIISINGKHITSTNNRGVVAVAQEEIGKEDVKRVIESAKTVSIPQSRVMLHVIPREFIVDAQGDIKDPEGMTGTRLEVDTHIISATASAKQNLEKCLLPVGLDIENVVFAGWASSLSTLTPTERELGVMLLDIGGGTTTITTFVEDAITYSASIPIGGSNLTSDLAIGLRVSLEDAEKIKLNAEDLMRNSAKSRPVSEMTKKREKLLNSLTGEDEVVKKKDVKKNSDSIDVSFLEINGVTTISRKMFEEIIEARLSEIFDVVVKQVEESGNIAKLPAGVVITGGTSLVPGITNIAKEVFGIPARIGYPTGLSGLVDEISSPAYSTVQGLITYSKQGEIEKGNEGGNSGVAGKAFFDKIKDFFKGLT